jgi:Methylase involved in ubiquinone/menaquinone biosynthesis
MHSIKKIKELYYSDYKVVEKYEVERFQTRGGKWLNQQEINTCLMLYPEKSFSVLDAPCGSGRLAEALSNLYNIQITCCDYSLAMLGKAKALETLKEANFIRSDVYNMPFMSNVFDIIYCIRFLAHSEDILSLIKEQIRLLRPGGIFIFDTVRWSPRNIFWKKRGGKIYAYTDRQIYNLLEKLKLDFICNKPKFILPMHAYSILPWSISWLFIKLEKNWPKFSLSHVFWKVQKRIP